MYIMRKNWLKAMLCIMLCGLLCVAAACSSSGSGSSNAPGTGISSSTGNTSGSSSGSGSGSGSGNASGNAIDANDAASGNASLGEDGAGATDTDAGRQTAQATVQPQSLDALTANTIQATITMADGGVIALELYPDLAPQSVRNFVHLAREGYYDGLTFHRIMKGFMIQGGCPQGTGGGGPGYTIQGEFSENGVSNDLLHERGVLSMARRNEPDSAGSQFFIMHANSPGLDGKYAAFGRVVNASGMDVVDRIAEIPNSGPNGAVADADKPMIDSITIDDDTELPPPDRIR